MTKAQQKIIIDKMKETIGYIRDADKNADCFCPSETIKKNMGNYFAGLAFALKIATGKEYNWSNGTDGKTWTLVIQGNTDQEVRQPIQ